MILSVSRQFFRKNSCLSALYVKWHQKPKRGKQKMKKCYRGSVGYWNQFLIFSWPITSPMKKLFGNQFRVGRSTIDFKKWRLKSKWPEYLCISKCSGPLVNIKVLKLLEYLKDGCLKYTFSFVLLKNSYGYFEELSIWKSFGYRMTISINNLIVSNSIKALTRSSASLKR